MHQDAAAATVIRRTMVLPLLLLMFSLSLFSSVTAECPDKCICRDSLFYCFSMGLGRIPDRIPPATKRLSLSGNGIRDIESLAQLTELEKLTLSYNDISELKNGAFSNLSKLEFLFLDGNKIENIETGVFNNLTSLIQLCLQNNKIHKLNLEMFKGLANLEYLYLNNNTISNIPPGTFDSLTSMRLLWLEDNPFTCDCNILLFVNFLKKRYPQRLFADDYPSCHFPVEMSGKLLKEITENDFNCTSPDVIVVPENKTVSVGEQLQLSCRAVGNPEPSITWTKDDMYIELGQRVQVLQNNTLIISKVERTDGSQYKCVASNSFGRKSFQAMVNVNAYPDIIVVPENKTVSVGEQLQLSCRAVGYPEPSITWAKDDIDLELGQRVQVLQNNTLIISKVERTDGGQYKCVASNSFGRKSFQAMVNVNVSSCVLPTVEGVVYTYEDSNESLSHGTLINHGVTVNENCTFGYHNVHPDSFRVCQKNGKWKPVFNKLCLKMCPPLLSDSVDIKCSYNGNYANCSNISKPGTIATPKCKPTYALPNGQKETPIELHCQSNGMWDDKLYICEPECGSTFVNTQVLIANGKKANIGTAPWNVAIYEKKFNYDLICGGSIISRNLVVSAAHCFWKSVTENITIIVNDGLYKIAVGKYDRNFSNIDNEITKLINVDRIYLKETYFGLSGYYAEDIAVVVLQNSVSFSNGITPICMDWNGIYRVSNGDQGKIVGWGKTENGIPSPVLLETHLPYMDVMRSCWSICKGFEFEKYVTADKFCAGSSLVSGHGVEKGDSGAGLCFLYSNLYYLTGVVSLKGPDAKNSISLFTSVNVHIPWIQTLYLEYKKLKYN